VPYTGDRHIDYVGAVLSILGMGGIVLGILAWEGGTGPVALLILGGALSLALLGGWLVRRKKAGGVALIDPDLFRSAHYRLGISSQMCQQIALGGLMIVLPMFLQMVLEYSAMQSGLSIAPLSLSMFFIALLAGRRAGRRRPALIIRAGFALLVLGMAVLIPFVPRIESGWWLVIPLTIAGAGLGMLVSQLNNYTLAPISEERISEAAGVNSAAGNFGLSFGLALAGAVMLGTLALLFTNMANASTVLTTDQKAAVSQELDQNAELLSNSDLQAQIADQPADVQAEIIRINTEARPIALQISLLVPLLVGIFGFLASLRMARLPDIKPSAAAEEFAFG